MTPRRSILAFLFALPLLLSFASRSPLHGDNSVDPKPANVQENVHAIVHRSPHQIAIERYFRDEVWPKVAEGSCLKCHNAKGDADESDLILRDPSKASPKDRAAILQHNLSAFISISKKQKKNQPVILQKVVGKMTHEGRQVLKPGSTRFRILEGFVHRVSGKAIDSSATDVRNATYDPPAFFEGVVMVEPRRLLRRATLSLAARLPNADELAKVDKGGLKAIDPILDQLMKEEAFYDRLAEGFNDIFLTRGYVDNAEGLLSYNHFPTRLWYQKYDLSDIKDPKERQRAGWELARVYRESLLREPMELIKHIVRNDHPFTEIVTANYTMVSPYTARGYGIFKDIKDRFKDQDDPFEYIPAKINALTHRNKRDNQVTPDGKFPHAGILGSFHWLKRYPTTETNRNRLRARMYYQHFLGIDVMALAPRVSDAAAVSAKYEIPTMQAADCVVCHTTIDPVAGLFQDYQTKSNDYGLGKEGWFKDMFGPGREGVDLPEKERWRVIPWLGEQTAKDPRFAVAMVEHVWYILTGRKVLLPPQDIEDSMFASKRRAYRMQRDEIEAVAEQFRKNKFNLKDVFKALVKSPFYRADGLATAVKHPRRKAELHDVGVVRMLSPEQLERKITAVFGKPWNQLNNQTAILYGGIDSKQITERIADPSGAMGAIQRIMANDVACKNVAVDFSLEPAKRRLFPNIEIDILPGSSAKADKQIRAAIVHLHAHILGRTDKPDSDDVDRTYRLFAGIVADAKAKGRFEKDESYFCRVRESARTHDPHYTLRAWRAVVTYLLRQQDFLYE